MKKPLKSTGSKYVPMFLPNGELNERYCEIVDKWLDAQKPQPGDVVVTWSNDPNPEIFDLTETPPISATPPRPA